MKKKLGILGKPAAKRQAQRTSKGSQASKARGVKKQVGVSSEQKWGLESQLHRQCASIIARLLDAQKSHSRGATVKGLCLAPQVKNKAAVYAVVCETLRHLPVLRELLDVSALLTEHEKMAEPAAYVLLYDLLIGQGVKPRGPAERAVLAAADGLKAKAQAMLAAAGAQSLGDLLPSSSRRTSEPVRRRSVRVNSLKMTPAEAMKLLVSPPPRWPDKHKVCTRPEADPHLPDMLHLPAGTDMHDHPLVEQGALILQGKSSSMPGHALSPGRGWHVVDCCAAPGNKTSHVAALVGRTGRVFAFEKDSKRAQLLRETVERAGAQHVTVHHGDFLKVDPSAKEYANVRGVILDPSCSGSGTETTRMDFLLPATTSNSRSGLQLTQACSSTLASDAVPAGPSGTTAPFATSESGSTGLHVECASFPGPTSSDCKRVLALAEFQTKILSHALTFPKLERLVYSTCSIFRQENEDVVAAVLPQAHALGFDLARALPLWPRRGLPLYSWTDQLVRVHPELDETDGFFVALFQRGRR